MDRLVPPWDRLSAIMAFICKQCAAFLLLLALLGQTFSSGVIVADFYANQDAIARNLCVNRDKPQMHCNGRCQLCKRLAQDNNNQDKNTPERKDNAKSRLLISPEASALTISGLPGAPLHHFPAPSADRLADRPSFCFHPPD
jgi:hypothetical protein